MDKMRAGEILRKVFIDKYDRCTHYEANNNKIAFGYRSEMSAIRVALQTFGEEPYNLPDLPPKPIFREQINEKI
jgi:hypothetical protein